VKAYQTAFRVSLSNLVRACGAMNGESGNIFKSRVVKILTSDWTEDVFLIVEIDGNYPYITNQWEQFIIPSVDP